MKLKQQEVKFAEISGTDLFYFSCHICLIGSSSRLLLKCGVSIYSNLITLHA